jgi:hypothetical protein
VERGGIEGSKLGLSVVLPVVVTPEVSRSLLCSRQPEAPQEAGFATPVMGLKKRPFRDSFKTGDFPTGIIAGNAHTPSYAAWLGRLIPGPFGTIEQDDIGRAFCR